MSPALIEVDHLTHRYGPLTAVDDLSFKVEQGEVLGLLGPNGAGKTTTMRAVVGLLAPTRGRIRIGGHDMSTEPVAAKRLLGYLPEAVSLYKELTVAEMLASAGRIKGVDTRALPDELDRVVVACGLEPVVNRLIGFCSRGYRQRIGLAQALIGDPPVLILDEPTVGMDPAQIVEIRSRIRDLARDKAVILSTHILPEASLLCSKVLILSAGRCVAEDSPEELERSLMGRSRLRVVCAAPAEGLDALFGTLEAVESAERVAAERGRVAWRVDLRSADDTPSLARALVESGQPLLEIGPERLGLEQVFLRLVRGDDPTTRGEGAATTGALPIFPEPQAKSADDPPEEDS